MTVMLKKHFYVILLSEMPIKLDNCCAWPSVFISIGKFHVSIFLVLYKNLGWIVGFIYSFNEVYEIKLIYFINKYDGRWML